jgi:hypothetical protein
MGISVGVGALLFFIGIAIGPALSGVLMQSNHIPNEDAGGALGASYPTLQSYNMIFLATGLLATVSLAFSVMLAKDLPTQKVGGDALPKH